MITALLLILCGLIIGHGLALRQIKSTFKTRPGRPEDVDDIRLGGKR